MSAGLIAAAPVIAAALSTAGGAFTAIQSSRAQKKAFDQLKEAKNLNQTKPGFEDFSDQLTGPVAPTIDNSANLALGNLGAGGAGSQSAFKDAIFKVLQDKDKLGVV